MSEQMDGSKENNQEAVKKLDLDPLKKEAIEGASLNAAVLDNDAENLKVILDIPVTVSMEVGKTKLSIRNLLKLNQGSVVELDRLAGDPLDVYVNGTLIAHGEVVIVNEKFAIRLTDVISTAERIREIG